MVRLMENIDAGEYIMRANVLDVCILLHVTRYSKSAGITPTILPTFLTDGVNFSQTESLPTRRIWCEF